MKKALAAGLALATLAGAAGAQQYALLPQDTNQDGYQSFDELTAWYASHIAALDRNGDGVSKAEFTQLYEQQVRDGSFTKADANKDGRLRGKEIAVMAAVIARQDMTFCDADKDGKISGAEEAACVSGDTITH